MKSTKVIASPFFRKFIQWSSLAGCIVLMMVCISCTKSESTSDSKPPELPESENVEKETETKEPGKVLRHAVFFKFKEESTAEDIAGVVEAFKALPEKITEIIDFKWGENNSPEGLNDGFTHCFLLTFQDAAGRDVYLPHADHKAFGDVLRPHMEKVFVIDYWGNAEGATLEKELKHAVFFKFKEDAPAEDIKAVEEAFVALPEKIDTIKDFEWGTNNSPEKHDAGFTHCFMVTFDSEEGRATYLPHDDHMAFVELIGPVLEKPRVLDFWIKE